MFRQLLMSWLSVVFYYFVRKCSITVKNIYKEYCLECNCLLKETNWIGEEGYFVSTFTLHDHKANVMVFFLKTNEIKQALKH